MGNVNSHHKKSNKRTKYIFINLRANFRKETLHYVKVKAVTYICHLILLDWPDWGDYNRLHE
jgi:hypothetical protein